MATLYKVVFTFNLWVTCDKYVTFGQGFDHVLLLLLFEIVKEFGSVTVYAKSR